MSEYIRMDGAILPYPKTGYNAIIGGEIGSLPNRRFSLPAFSLLHNEQTLTRCLNMDEVKDFHPRVARWLRKQGYKTDHHVHLDHGIVDFIATHRETGEVLCIECKVHASIGNREIGQVLVYAQQIPDCIPCIVIPSDEINEKAQDTCDYFGIRLIGVKVKRPKQKKEKKSSRFSRPKFIRPAFSRKHASFTRWHSDFKKARQTAELKSLLFRVVKLEADKKRRNRPRWLHTGQQVGRYIPIYIEEADDNG